MMSLSFSLNDSSTAFLIHWCVVHCPTPSRVATRSAPLFNWAMVCSTASLISADAWLGDSSARCSQAALITEASWSISADMQNPNNT